MRDKEEAVGLEGSNLVSYCDSELVNLLETDYVSCVQEKQGGPVSRYQMNYWS